MSRKLNKTESNQEAVTLTGKGNSASTHWVCLKFNQDQAEPGQSVMTQYNLTEVRLARLNDIEQNKKMEPWFQGLTGRNQGHDDVKAHRV